MEVDKDEMARTFSDLTDEELLRRHASGELTDIGYSILERELTGRGINIPRRHPGNRDTNRKATFVARPLGRESKSC